MGVCTCVIVTRELFVRQHSVTYRRPECLATQLWVIPQILHLQIYFREVLETIVTCCGISEEQSIVCTNVGNVCTE